MKWIGHKNTSKSFSVKPKNKPFSFFQSDKKKNRRNNLQNKKLQPLLNFSRNFEFIKKPNYLHWIACSVSGLLAGLCLPNDLKSSYSGLQSLLIWVALVPFFLVLWSSKNYFQVLCKSFLAGFCFNFIGFYFLSGIHPLTWLGVPDNLSITASFLAVFIAASQQGIYWACFGFLFKLIQKTLGISQWSALHGGILWVILIEKIANSLNLGGNPLTSLYYTQHNNLSLIQASDLLGASLFSFLIVFVNISIASYFQKSFPAERNTNFTSNKDKSKQFFSCLSMTFQSVVLLSLCFGYSFWFFNSHRQHKLPSVRTLLMQNGLSISDTRGATNKTNAKEYLKTFEAVNKYEYPGLAIIPEGTIPENKLDDTIQDLSEVNSLTSWIVGSYYSDESFKGFSNSFNSAVAYNSSISWNHNFCNLHKDSNLKDRKQLYLKRVLVPFGEFIPFKEVFIELLQQLELEFLTDNEFQTGSEAKSFNFSFGKVSPLVCYEIAFPEIVHSQVQSGAEALVLIGDTAWFHQNRKQVSSLMIAAAKFRAIESRRDIAISINKGPLVLIDSLGSIKALKINANHLLGQLSLNKQKSVFSKNYKSTSLKFD
ncbi:MAG: apolipoprotein N-acyltransferase [Candidatus Caenarcaniphilales bacterium]|nr:apolipoprotein N-acyltransferase [Candidatus Caenarcaniphilales bacterium]